MSVTSNTRRELIPYTPYIIFVIDKDRSKASISHTPFTGYTGRELIPYTPYIIIIDHDKAVARITSNIRRESHSLLTRPTSPFTPFTG